MRVPSGRVVAVCVAILAIAYLTVDELAAPPTAAPPTAAPPTAAPPTAAPPTAAPPVPPAGANTVPASINATCASDVSPALNAWIASRPRRQHAGLPGRVVLPARW